MKKINVMEVETTTNDSNKLGKYYRLILKIKCLDNKIRNVEYLPNASRLTVRLDSSITNRYYSLDERLPERLFGTDIYEIFEDEYIKSYKLNKEEANNLRGEFFRREPADNNVIEIHQNEYYIGRRVRLYIEGTKERPLGVIIDNSEIGINKGFKHEGLILTVKLDNSEIIKTSIGNVIHKS